jgi:hypothetical protein
MFLIDADAGATVLSRPDTLGLRDYVCAGYQSKTFEVQRELEQVDLPRAP